MALAPNRPLAGLLVVSIEQAVAAPMCTMRLADAGARVLKIEPPEGETARHYDGSVAGVSSYFASLNRGKESVCLDLSMPEDRALIERILAKADVFMRNTSPGAMARRGLDATELCVRFPQLIVVDIVGYGQHTDSRALKAYDMLVQAEAGLCSVTGTPDEPCKIGVSIVDMGTGMNAYAAILEALLSRAQTGRGAALELAMFDTAAEWMSVPLLQFEQSGKGTGRHGMAHASIYPYRPYPCRDGAVIVAVQNNAQFSAFCRDVLQAPGLGDDPRFQTNALRVENRTALDALIVDVSQSLTTADLIARLKRAGTAYATLTDVTQLGRHAALRRQPVTVGKTRVDGVASPLRALGPDVPSLPGLGEHTDAVRAEFG